MSRSRPWYVEITDTFPACPGKVVTGPYPTRKEAGWYWQQERDAAKKLFTDGRANLSVRFFQ